MPSLFTAHILRLGLVPVVLVGCAHAQPTQDKAKGDAILVLRRENAELRRQNRMLKDQLRQAERQSAGAYTLPDGRELPVVRLGDSAMPPPRAAQAEPTKPAPTRFRDPITLDPLPHSSPELMPSAATPDPVPHPATTAPSLGPAPAQATEPPPTAPAAQPSEAAPDSRSFRLVGSRLVELTKTKRPPPTGPKRKRSRRSASVKAEYDAAMGVYREGQLREAELAFDHIARTYPRHDYADNALYWKGEAAYDQEHYADALAAFTSVVERYGGGNKAPDALLKIGLCYGKLGDRANAHDVLTQLVAGYPAANATRIAREKLHKFEVR